MPDGLFPLPQVPGEKLLDWKDRTRAQMESGHGEGSPTPKGKAEEVKTPLPCSPPEEKSGQATARVERAVTFFQHSFGNFTNCSVQHTPQGI